MYKLVALALIAASISAQTSSTTNNSSSTNTASTNTASTNNSSTAATTSTTANTAAYPADKYCLSGANAKCTLCAYSYLNSSGICQAPTTKISNCLSYTNATTCGTCADGYNLVSNACQAITITDCLAVTTTTTAATSTTAATTSTTCSVCNNAKLPANGSCTNGTACSLSNCSICASATRCYQCAAKYAINTDGTCVSENTANCRVGTTSACTTCDLGYYNTGTACTSSSVQGSTYIVSAVVALLAFVKLIA